MPRTRAELIETLTRDLRPARGPRRAETLVLLWLVVSWSAVLAAMLASGPFREGWLEQLGQSPRFLLESAVGLAAGASAIVLAVRLGIPGSRVRPLWAALVALLLLWVGLYLLDMVAPALEPSTRGQRPGCALEVVLFALPPLLLGVVLLRRLAPLARARTGALLGAAAGAIPGLLMQLACMYVPAHILAFHLAPIALLAGAGALLGVLALRRI